MMLCQRISYHSPRIDPPDSPGSLLYTALNYCKINGRPFVTDVGRGCREFAGCIVQALGVDSIYKGELARFPSPVIGAHHAVESFKKKQSVPMRRTDPRLKSLALCSQCANDLPLELEALPGGHCSLSRNAALGQIQIMI